MAYPTGQFASRLQQIDGTLASLKSSCAAWANQLRKGGVPVDTLLGIHGRLYDVSVSIGDAKQLVVNIPNFETYIRAQKDTDPGSVVDALFTIVKACETAMQAVKDCIPLDGAGNLLAWTWSGRGAAPTSFDKTDAVSAALDAVAAEIE